MLSLRSFSRWGLASGAPYHKPRHTGKRHPWVPQKSDLSEFSRTLMALISRDRIRDAAKLADLDPDQAFASLRRYPGEIAWTPCEVAVLPQHYP